MLIGGLLMMLFWGALIYLLFVGVQKLTSHNDSRDTGRALETLKERYAKGEITHEEYEKIRKNLEK